MAFVRLGAFDAVDALCDGGVCTRYISKSHIVPASHKKILINVGKSYNCGHTRYSTINLWIKKELLPEKLLHVFFSDTSYVPDIYGRNGQDFWIEWSYKQCEERMCGKRRHVSP